MKNELTVSVRGRVGTSVHFVSKEGQRAYASFRLGVSPSWKDSEGNWKSGTTEWLTAKAWGFLAENIQKSVLCGEPVLAFGTIHTEIWKDRQGNIRHSNALHLDALGHDLHWGKSFFQSSSSKRDEGKKPPADSERAAVEEPSPWDVENTADTPVGTTQVTDFGNHKDADESDTGAGLDDNQLLAGSEESGVDLGDFAAEQNYCAEEMEYELTVTK